MNSASVADSVSSGVSARVARRARNLYIRQRRIVAQRTDRMFAVLMLLQWLAGIAVAMWFTPRAWSGRYSTLHPHVYSAIFLGGLISGLPILLAVFQPGRHSTRYVIATAQMLWSALFIHLSGGRIEAHFHVFGSLAFLAIYRDWRVLVPATIVTASDHLLRGMFWPESVYGVLTASYWRTLEHSLWVIFEDTFLVISCIQQTSDMRLSALRQAELESNRRALRQTHAELEQRVADRTAELSLRNLELSHLSEIAKAASTAKTAFLANMSHEIRTPMTAILGFSELLLEPNQTVSEKLDALQVIRRNARHLLDLINDILDISKIEAGRMTVECIEIDLLKVVGDVVSIMRPRAIEKGLRFQTDFASDIPRTIRSDPLRLKQILVNLLGNALKFTECGKLTLSIECRRSGNESQIRFAVSDTGVGMTAPQMARLFQPFSQGDESTTRRFGGTGLGLTISQRLASALGGDIAVESQVGHGSTFTAFVAGGDLQGIEMLGDVHEGMLSGSVDPAGPSIAITGRILLVEDGLDNQQLISLQLRKAGATVTIVENGLLGVAMACKQPFDLILMDMQMPEMDGYTAAGDLRKKGMALPIIALTAHAMSEDRVKCLAAGCSDFLSKPVPKDQLLGTVARWLDAAQPVDQPPAELKAARTEIQSTYAGDADMQELIADFVARLPAQVQQLTDLLAQHDVAHLCEVVHQLKGAGGGYGFAEITQRAGLTERAIKAGSTIDTVTTEIESLVRLLQRVRGYNEKEAGRAKASGH